MSFWDAKKLFQILPFYNTFIEKPDIKKLSNIKLLHELPFYDELNVVKSSNAFSGYARSCKVEIVDREETLVQLQVSKSSIEDLFKDLFNEMKGFKYQITVTVLLSKAKISGNIEYSPVYFNSATETVINSEFNLDKSFQGILYRIDNWINEGSGWIVESIDGDYVNISAYSPLVGSSYIELSSELKNSMKGLINIKNNDNKCFLWCHVRHLNLVERNPQRITRKDKELVNKLECILKKVASKSSEYNSNSSYPKKYQDHIPCSFAYKVVCIHNKYSKKFVLYRGKNAVYKFIKSILNEYNYCRKVIKVIKHFNKILLCLQRRRKISIE